MTVEQWMKSKNIAAYGPHLEPIIRLAFESGHEAAHADPTCECCDCEAEHLCEDGTWLCGECYAQAVSEDGR